MIGTGANNQITQLLQDRYHGALNISGIRYQLTYSLLRAFDLYKPNAPVAVRLEGIEDVDVRKIELTGLTISNQYVQVKTSNSVWDWSRFARSKIIQNFLPVWSADPSAELLVVTNFGFRDKLDEFAKFCAGRRGNLSGQALRNLRNLCERAGYSGVDLFQLMNHIAFERIPDEELTNRAISAISRSFDLSTGNVDLYFLVLVAKFLDVASRRGEVRRSDLEATRLAVEELIEMGAKNPAVQNGWIERLAFTQEEHPEDYYEGKNARPGHILAGMDVRRPVWETRIHDALQRSRVCVVRASSGQGKSTLLYRYAYTNFHPETTLVVKQLSSEDMVGSVKQAIVARQRLGLPILVFIDNVGSGLRFWHKLVAEFAGQNVYFLITIREEDWYRYAGSASGFVWEVVTPELSLDEARRIYAEFAGQKKVAAEALSAEWAFEQVAERRLLIEYTYLITHGQMLVDRLSDQVQDMLRLGEDRAKLQILRLVSVAQAFGAKVKVEALLKHIHFDHDPDSTLASLEREYLLFMDGLCEGLHLVRSQHLVSLLHQVTPREQTMVELIQILDPDNLESLVESIFADPGIDHAPLLGALVDRCSHEPVQVINRMAMALFAASEAAYYRLHKTEFDQAFEAMGDSGVSMLSWATLPAQLTDPIADLQKVVGEDHANLKLISGLAGGFKPRQWDQRLEVQFLRGIVESIPETGLTSDISEIGKLLGWCRLARVDPSRLVQFLASHDWRPQIYHADLVSAASLLTALHDHARENYDWLVASDKALLAGYFKLLTDTLTIEESDSDVFIEFIVDQTENAPHPNEQAVERLRNLWRFFPYYTRYRSRGLYPAMHGVSPPHDDTEKDMPNDALRQEIEAERNRAYTKVVESHYAAQSVYEWQQQWVALRRELLAFTERAIDLFSSLLRGERPDVNALNSALRASLLQELHRKGAPDSLSLALDAERKSMNDWIWSISVFMRQFGQHDPLHDTVESTLMMRYNLRDAVKKLPSAQQAFHRAVAKTQLYFETSDLDEREAVGYSDLADTLDIWFERPNAGVGNLRKTIEGWRQSRRKEFSDAVRSTMAPLERHGFQFTYPTGPLLDHPLVGVALAFEVSDFEQVVSQLLVITAQCASFPLECHFVYLIPLLKGQRYLPTLWRISLEHAHAIAQGNLDEKEWALLPLDPPDTLFEILPGIPEAALDELRMSSEFYRIYGALNTARNTLQLIQSRLTIESPFEAQLAKRHRSQIQTEVDRLSAETQSLLAQMLEFATDNPAAREWLQFYQCCSERLESSRDVASGDSGEFREREIWQDFEVQSLFGRYLNARYLNAQPS